ncbi:MAG: dihydroorotase [Acutalibacteraceae bacterium]|nr:dihydroorotase [Acutalibacteraceae bacterium]
MVKILIKNAHICDPATNMDCEGDIFLVDGVIADIGTDLDYETEVTIDASGLIAAPGLVDMHVHLRDPGQTEKEDIISGCKAAAAGGVTSVLAMPNTNPTVDNVETVQYILNKAKDADAHVYVSAAITKGLQSDMLCNLAALKEAGAIALSDDGRPVVNTEFMAEAMQAAPKLGMTVVSHCEDLYLAKGGIIHEGKVAEELGVKGIPAAAEDCGTAREIALAAAYNVPIHICHVSTATSIALIRDAKARGVAVTAETAPHYFTLTEEELLKRDADYRMNPPLRTEADRLAVIEGLKDGTLDAIATDHAPHTPTEKADFEKAPNGVIGMETSLSAGITALVQQGHCTMLQLIEKMSTKPAQLLGIPAGTLKKGSPADVILIDKDEEWTVDVDKLHGKSKNCVFKNRKLTGKVKFTVCGGKIVFNELD